jgi:tRNA(fMet)-specific endonuclease VapC
VGIVLDSTLLVSAERAGLTPRQVIAEMIASQGDVEAVVSVITVVELAHGIERANSKERRLGRERFLAEVLAEITVEPITVPIALRAGRIDGKLQAEGKRVSLADLLIGTTALELGYSVATHNVRHFEMIPDLAVKRP